MENKKEEQYVGSRIGQIDNLSCFDIMPVSLVLKEYLLRKSRLREDVGKLSLTIYQPSAGYLLALKLRQAGIRADNLQSLRSVSCALIC